MAQGSLTVLDHWKVRKLRDSDLPLEIGVGSLESGPALIQAKRTGPVEWGVRWSEISLLHTYSRTSFADILR